MSRVVILVGSALMLRKLIVINMGMVERNCGFVRLFIGCIKVWMAASALAARDLLAATTAWVAIVVVRKKFRPVGRRSYNIAVFAPQYRLMSPTLQTLGSASFAPIFRPKNLCVVAVRREDETNGAVPLRLSMRHVLFDSEMHGEALTVANSRLAPRR